MKRTRSFIVILLTAIVNPAFAQNTTFISSWEDNLISLKVFTPSNDTLLLYTDTGGKNFLYRGGLKKLELKKSKKNLWGKNLERLFQENNLPIPNLEELYFIRDKTASEDGMLGREWFAGRAWHFDYEQQSLSVVSSSTEKSELAEKIPIGFKKDSIGNQTDHLPRLEVIIDKDTLAFLFDTGAQTFLSAEAQTYFESAEKVAASFINAGYFEKWKVANPDWTIIKGGDVSFRKKADMIVVPQIKIGERSVGPVAFARREDINFEIMSERFMDEEIVGAIGGNCLSLLESFIIDYQNETLSIPSK